MNVMEAHGLRKTYESEGAPVRALRGVDMTMVQGEFVAIMGPSGCGKSTLLNLVAGLDVPSEGEITVAGEPLTGMDESALARMRRRHIGIVLQEPFLFYGTIAENIAYGRPQARRGEIIAAAQAARAHEFILRLPDAYDLVVGNPPWIAWDHLPPAYRAATKPLWEKYGLFSLSGNEARHGGGKKDLSMLMTYTSADRYLKPHGRLAFVITQTVFQTRGAGDGFRRFRLGAEGAWL